MKEIIRDREKIFDFSLHDSRIKKISLKDDNLILSLDYVFQYC